MRHPAAPRTVVITGASAGLGAALARCQARTGTRLVLVARNADRLEHVAADCRARGAGTVLATIDVRNTDEMSRFIAEIDARWPIDAVFANAGIEASLGPAQTAEPLGSVLAQFRTNFEGVAATVTPLLDPMRRRGRGKIVLISSLAALIPLPDQPAYCASKAAVLAWGEALAPWLRAAGVQLIVVCPGFIKTGMSERYQGWRPVEWSAERAARHICREIEAGRRHIRFPFSLRVLILLGLGVPRPVRDWVIGRFFNLKISVRSGAA